MKWRQILVILTQESSWFGKQIFNIELDLEYESKAH